jgi:hypothetical protein
MTVQRTTAVPDLEGVRNATVADERRTIDTLVVAFSSDPVMRWLYPDPHDYLRHFPEFVGALAGRAFDRERPIRWGISQRRRSGFHRAWSRMEKR